MYVSRLLNLLNSWPHFSCLLDDICKDFSSKNGFLRVDQCKAKNFKAQKATLFQFLDWKKCQMLERLLWYYVMWVVSFNVLLFIKFINALSKIEMTIKTLRLLTCSWKTLLHCFKAKRKVIQKCRHGTFSDTNRAGKWKLKRM